MDVKIFIIALKTATQSVVRMTATQEPLIQSRKLFVHCVIVFGIGKMVMVKI